MAHVTFFKHDNPKPSARVQRALRRINIESAEDREKAEVRRRDKGCRFPLCGCRKLRLALEVSHNEHKGSGGNPDGSRSTAPLMMQLCRERHSTNVFSVHNRVVEWVPLYKKLGANGPVKWLVDLALLRYYIEGGRRPSTVRLTVVAIEGSPGVLEVVSERAALESLAEMRL